MNSLIRQRCGHHADREAVARCPVCRNFFCRECVTEHAGRMICSRCLAETAASGPQKSRVWSKLAIGVRALVGLFLVWFLFYAAGRTMLLIPSEFHEGTLWQGAWWEED